MHAILTPVGSSGDINPFAIVGAELRRRGHRVSLLATDGFAQVAARAGLEFVSVGTKEEYERTIRDPDLWNARRGPAIVFGVIAQHLQRGYAAIERVYEPKQTVLVGHSLSFSTRVFEEVHRVPAVTMHLSPSVFRSDFAQSALPSGQDLSSWPRWAKRGLWWGLDRFAIDPLIVPALNRWRAQLGLPAISRIFKSWLHSPQRVVGLFPEWFGDPQPDWPAQLRLPGFVLSDATCAPGTASADTRSVVRADLRADVRAVVQAGTLDEFLSTGTPPIVFTPGSANRHGGPFFRAGIDAAAAIGRRALFVTPYRDQLPSTLPPHVQHVDYAPFDTLFATAAAVVHHGGIGTCAQGFAAGVPQLVMPLGFDQPDNAARLKKLGVGDWIPPGRFRAKSVTAVLGRLLSDPQVAAACRSWQNRIDSSRSRKQVCDLIEQQFAAAASGTGSATGVRV